MAGLEVAHGSRLFADDTSHLKMFDPRKQKDQDSPHLGPMKQTNGHGPARAPQAHKQTDLIGLHRCAGRATGPDLVWYQPWQWIERA